MALRECQGLERLRSFGVVGPRISPDRLVALRSSIIGRRLHTFIACSELPLVVWIGVARELELERIVIEDRERWWMLERDHEGRRTKLHMRGDCWPYHLKQRLTGLADDQLDEIRVDVVVDPNRSTIAGVEPLFARFTGRGSRSARRPTNAHPGSGSP